MSKIKISVVVCCLNEEARIKQCLSSILLNDPDEIIIVDGGSQDKTISIAKKYTKNIYSTINSNLTLDRQLGIDKSRNKIIAMIDSDHILKKDDLSNLHKEFVEGNYDILQSGLASNSKNFWNSCENIFYELFHNNPPGERSMIGTAPAIYNKKIFDKIKFDDHITKTIDDTDFIYRLKKNTNFKIGIAKLAIIQDHNSNYYQYLKKFYWYGRGDCEFILKNNSRLLSMVFHLLIRYPILYSVKSIFHLKPKLIPFVVTQGLVRFIGLISRLFY